MTEQLLILFGHVVVWDARLVPQWDYVEYFAYSWLFDEVADNESVPEYQWVFNSKNGEVMEVIAKRVEITERHGQVWPEDGSDRTFT